MLTHPDFVAEEGEVEEKEECIGDRVDEVKDGDEEEEENYSEDKFEDKESVPKDPFN